MHKLEIKNIHKRFGNAIALEDISLKIDEGEFVSFLGPSGCGKTTALRVIAGLVKPDQGRILINGTDVTDIPSRFRNLGMVFQNYALFPHMTVFENLAFGLEVDKVSKKDISKMVEESLSTVKLTGFEDRLPNQLSGGQQQRVALARALIKNPQILLMDEPLSNLDAKLRLQMRNEIRGIQKKLNITAIFVTHDQEEAISMSDRVVVIQQGKIIQVGTPIEIYEFPQSIFVADFIGKTNIIEGRVELDPSKKTLMRIFDKFSLEVGTEYEKYQGKTLTFSVRPDRIPLSSGTPNNIQNQFPVKIISSTYMGPFSSYVVSIGKDINLNVIRPTTKNEAILDEEEICFIEINPDNLILVHEE